MKIIGYIHTDFKEKFGIPRQSGAGQDTRRIVLEPPYNDPQALRGLEEFSHIWVIWDFSLAHGENSGKDDEDDCWTPTVRPPRLGGNKRVGVFASRSPFRPNPHGTFMPEDRKHRCSSKRRACDPCIRCRHGR